MPVFAVRHRFNYHNVEIEQDGSFIGSALTRNELPVLMADGHKKFYRFSGSISLEKRHGLQLVKVVDIAAYTLDPADVLRRRWIDVTRQHYCAAVLVNESIMFLLDDGKLVTRALPEKPLPPKDNVIPISTKRRG